MAGEFSLRVGDRRIELRIDPGDAPQRILGQPELLQTGLAGLVTYALDPLRGPGRVDLSIEVDRDYRKKKDGLIASDHAPVILEL